jgi:hypothetical protein
MPALTGEESDIPVDVRVAGADHLPCMRRHGNASAWRACADRGGKEMSEAIYCFDTATVRFAIYPDGPAGGRVVAEISEDPLRDFVGADGGGDTLVEAYKANASIIDACALERYHETPHHPVLLEIRDFEAMDNLAGA